jgi:DNA-binding GntR family transcriptional regulator
VTTASNKAFEIIRAEILSGRFAGGAHLTETELTELCGVSRTPVREALRRLAISGLVIFTPHQGARVAIIDLGEIDEIYALRAMIEGHAARRAAMRISAQNLARLKALAQDMENAVNVHQTEVADAFLSANQEFHHIILDAAQSPKLSAMAALVIEVPLALRTLSHYSDQELTRSMRHHRELIAAFEASDPEWAEAVMRSHIHAAANALSRGADDADLIKTNAA